MRESTIPMGMPSVLRTPVIAGIFVGLVAVVALAASPSPARAATASQLQKAGWTCIAPEPVTDELHCFGPNGLQRLFTEEAKAVKAVVFDPSGQEFLGVEINIRGDIFHGQPCPTDPPSYEYTYLGPIFGVNYWACHRFDSDHL